MICSPTATGKTYLLKDILHHIHEGYGQNIIMFSGTAKLQDVYNFFPRTKIFDEYIEKEMEAIWDQQFKADKKKREKVLIILDDVLHDKEFKNSKVFKKVSTGGRHLDITIIFLTQYLKAVGPIIRNNTRLFIAFETDSYKEREKIIDDFLSFDTKAEGDAIYKEITKTPYQCMLVCVYKKDKQGKVYKYIAKDRPDLKIMDEEKEKPRNYLKESHTPSLCLIKKNIRYK
jgi:hypothetical protein